MKKQKNQEQENISVNSADENIVKNVEENDNGNIYKNLEEISEWLKKVKIRKKIIGGVSEKDAWKRIDELNRMYESAYKELVVYYETIIEGNKEKK